MPASPQRLPLKVLYIDHTAKNGGGEIALLNLVQHLDREVVDPEVLLFSEGPLADRLRPIATTRVLALSPDVLAASKDQLGWKSLLKVREIFNSVRYVLSIYRYLRAVKVDIVHTNSLKSDLIGGLAGRMARVKVIWHVRDRIEDDYLPSKIVWLFRFLCRILPHYVIANSAATLATLCLDGKQHGSAIASGVVPRDRMSVVHDGCRADEPRLTNSEDSAPRIGLIGRISPWKGQDVYIRAAAIVHRRYPRARFEIIGAPLFAEQEYEAYLHQLCRDLSLEEVVVFTGFVNDIPEKISTLDIVVHASTTGEPFGQVIIESMVEEKPVVATNGGGVPEIVDDGVTGILVPMKSVTEMAAAIEYLLDHPEEGREMGRRGRDKVLSRFTIQQTARLVEDVYRGIMAHG